MAAWPATLPQELRLEGMQEQTVDVLLRSPMDAGPPKVRPLYRSAPVDIAGDMVMTTAQVATLETFFETTLNWGADSFDWTHPRTRAAATFMFAARPGYAAVGAGYWRVSLQLRIWP